jgi:glycosyltransferase 2 family protein
MPKALAVVGLVVSALFGYLAVRGIDGGLFWNGIRTSDYWVLAPATFVLAVGVALRAFRWQLLFAIDVRPPFRPVLDALLVGYFFNTVLPARAGEVARVLALKRTSGVPRSEGIATVATERAHDLVALLLILAAVVPFAPRLAWLPAAGLVAVALAVTIGAVVLVLTRYGDRPGRFLLGPLARLPGVSRARTDTAAANLVRGFSGLTRLSVALPVFALTVASWLVIALSFWILMLGFDFGAPRAGAVMVVVATNLALVVPSGPSGLGVFEAATIIALRPFGVDRPEALSFAVILHALNAVPYIVVGVVLLRQVGAKASGDEPPSRYAE